MLLELCSTEVESFVLIESSYSADFALQCGKAWNRNFVGRDFCNTFVLIRDGGLCLFVEKSLQRINPSFRSNQLYKTFRLIANYFLSRNKIKFRHSFVSAQVFGLPSSTGPLGFPNKVCDIHLPRIPCKCPRLLQQLFGLDEKRRIAGVKNVAFYPLDIQYVSLTNNKISKYSKRRSAQFLLH